jgi:hypothetical protein
VNRAGAQKALVEFKASQRSLVIGNILEQGFSQQNYPALLYNGAANQQGNQIFATHRDATVVRNIVRFFNSGSLMLAGSFGFPTLPNKRTYWADNLMYGFCGSSWPNAWSGGNGSSCSGFQTSAEHGFLGLALSWRSLRNITIEHNTILDANWTPYASAGQFGSKSSPIVDSINFAYRNNIVSSGHLVSIAHNDMSGANGTSVQLNGEASSALKRNLFVDPVDAGWVATHGSRSAWTFHWGPSKAWDPYFLYGGSQSGIGFNNAPNTTPGAASDYTLKSTSPYHSWGGDGKDPGIDSALNSETSCVVTGVACNPLP